MKAGLKNCQFLKFSLIGYWSLVARHDQIQRHLYTKVASNIKNQLKNILIKCTRRMLCTTYYMWMNQWKLIIWTEFWIQKNCRELISKFLVLMILASVFVEYSLYDRLIKVVTRRTGWSHLYLKNKSCRIKENLKNKLYNKLILVTTEIVKTSQVYTVKFNLNFIIKFLNIILQLLWDILSKNKF